MSRNEHAIVIGGSMAGLLASRVLSNHFDHVTLIERDELPNVKQNRRGVPQGRHTHGLLAGGRQILDLLFPGISAEMAAVGAIPGDMIRQCRWFFEGECHMQSSSPLEGMLMSRPFVEHFVRERVRQIPNIAFRDGVAVDGLLTSADNQRVLGVKIGNETITADLVVDAAGRGSHALQWIEALGYEKPVEQRVEVSLSYVTRYFRRSPEELNGDLAAIIAPTPGGKVGGVMLAQEESRWTVTMLSHFGPAAPSDLEGFIEFSRHLPASYIYDVIRHAEPLGEPLVTRFPASVRRRYENLKRFPERLLVIGDAICSFNPIYGQGMTVSAMEAVELDKVLAGGLEKIGPRFFAKAAKAVDIPWGMAVGNDLRMPEATGPRTTALKVINAYMKQLHKAAHTDPKVALAFHMVGNLLAQPPHVLRPAIAWRVLWGIVKRALLPQPAAKLRLARPQS